MKYKEKREIIDWVNSLNNYYKYEDLCNFINEKIDYKINGIQSDIRIEILISKGFNVCGKGKESFEINEIESFTEIHEKIKYTKCLTAFIDNGKRRELDESIYKFIKEYKTLNDKK